MCGASSTIRLAQSILRRKFPSVDKPLRISAPPKISPSKTAFEKYKPRGLIIFRILRYVSLKSARLFRLNSALIVGCLRFFFFGSGLEQSFPEGIIKPYEGTILTTVKVCCVKYLLVFRLISGYTGERLIPG